MMVLLVVTLQTSMQAAFQRIEDQGQALGLHLNVDKSELVSYDESAVTVVSVRISGTAVH